MQGGMTCARTDWACNPCLWGAPRRCCLASGDMEYSRVIVTSKDRRICQVRPACGAGRVDVTCCLIMASKGSSDVANSALELISSWHLEDWGGYLRAIEGRSEATVRKYVALVSRVARSVDIGPGEIVYPDLEAHLRELYLAGRSDSTRALLVSALRGYFAWQAARGEIARSPAVALRRPRVYGREADILTAAEVELLIYGPRRGGLPRSPRAARDRVLLAVTYICGLRASEPGRLRIDALEWVEEDGVFLLLLERAKGARGDVRVTTDRDAARMIGAYLDGARRQLPGGAMLFPSLRTGGVLTRAGVAGILRRRIDEVGIETKGRRISPHTLRHSIATHLLAAGVNIRVVQEHMRHASVETTQRYTHVEGRRIARQIERAHPLRGARRRSRAPSMHRAVRGLLEELREGV